VDDDGLAFRPGLADKPAINASSCSCAVDGALIDRQRRRRNAVRAVQSPPTSNESDAMNKDIISGKWTQLKGKIKAQWGDLTDDDFDVATGNAQYLSGKLQERYGWDRDRAEKEVRTFQDGLGKEYRD
jgi:uncharacterized protein YjbJ (UPF0337 family)